VCVLARYERQEDEVGWLLNSCLGVEANDSPVTSMDDKSGSTTSWTEVVSKKKKKPDGLKKKVIFSSSLVGKQSDPRLTLFTKRS
jgi:hypothetical protein